MSEIYNYIKLKSVLILNNKIQVYVKQSIIIKRKYKDQILFSVLKKLRIESFWIFSVFSCLEIFIVSFIRIFGLEFFIRINSFFFIKVVVKGKRQKWNEFVIVKVLY